MDNEVSQTDYSEFTDEVGRFTGTVIGMGDGSSVKIEDLAAFVHSAQEGGYWAEVPALPGCLTQGETLDEVVENLNDAIRGWLSVQTPESLREKGVPFTLLSASVDLPNRFPRVRTLELAA